MNKEQGTRDKEPSNRSARSRFLIPCSLFLVRFSVLLSSSCRESPSEPTRADAAAAIEPWTLGVAHSAITLPPGCEHRAPPLRAVVPRPTRLAADPGTLGFVLVAEGGPGVPLQSTERGRGVPDGAALLELGEGSVRVTPAPWRDARPLVARAGERWLFALAGKPAELVRANARETIDGAPVDLRCRNTHCALLVDEPAALYAGGADAPLAGWKRTLLGSGRPIAVVADPRNAPPFAAAIEQAGALALPPAISLPIAGEALAAIATPPLALARRVTAGIRCGDEPGGVDVLAPGAAPRRLLGAAPAERASLHPVAGGALVLWIAPARCGASARLLYGAFLRPDGEPLGPVTALAEADDYAAASRGSFADVWVTAAGTASWARAGCMPR